MHEEALKFMTDQQNELDTDDGDETLEIRSEETLSDSALPESAENPSTLNSVRPEWLAAEPKEEESAGTELELEDSPASDVFPPEVFSSAKLRGARKTKVNDPSALDLRIEGLLFVTDVPLTSADIARILGVRQDDVTDTMRAMTKSFSRRRSALELRERVRRGLPAYIIDLKAEYRPDVKALARPALPKRYIQTLALIALNQPLKQSRLVRDIGQRAYDHVRELVERGLVSKMRDGLSYSLRTTSRFSSEFGLSNNPLDLRSQLAKKLTEDEQEAWRRYREHERLQKLEEQAAQAALEPEHKATNDSRRASNSFSTTTSNGDSQAAANTASAPSSEADSYDSTIQEAEALLSGGPAASTSYQVTSSSGRSEAQDSDLQANAAKTDAAKTDAKADLSGHKPSVDSSKILRGFGSKPQSPAAPADPVDPEDDEAKMTRFQKLFMQLKAKRDEQS